MTVKGNAQGNSGAALPRHIAIVMDGNGRWARARRLPRVEGHRRGVETARKMVQACLNHGVPYLTLFAFSSENWRRPTQEVSFLMRLFLETVESEQLSLAKNGVRLRVVGDLSTLQPALRSAIDRAQQRTAGNKALNLTIAANYGGRWDMLQSLQACVRADPSCRPECFTEAMIARHLSMAFAPDPDLLIRTGGEQRLSNFLLWQLAYSELYFTQTPWPEFDEKRLEEAVGAFLSRERRFGRTTPSVSGRLIPLDANSPLVMSSAYFHLSRFWNTELVRRTCTALTLLGVLAFLVAFSQTWALGAVGLTFLATAQWEWLRLLGVRNRGVLTSAVTLAGIGFGYCSTHWAGGTAVGALFLAFVSSLFYLVWVPMRLSRKSPFSGEWLASSFLLLSCWVALLLLYQRGSATLFSVMGVVWVADVLAYFVGRCVGRRKLAPLVSPGKTLEGVFGAMACICFLALFLAKAQMSQVWFVPIAEKFGMVVMCSALVSVVVLSVLGDLYESLLKREKGVKDSGALLPGHGGVFDRIDALIPAIPFTLLLMHYLGVI